ncbi:hypothetical protein AMTR_s00140p00040660 [Amborella trichopoda]|uniref:Uncharacterized protein n=1 Tax=Amborella trichopoda TaxID=13333 RepID=W1PAZ1_AMBTC|nr:hypothetical protein AMTR_s00140p00040660 [Amborella trichopoda]
MALISGNKKFWLAMGQAKPALVLIPVGRPRPSPTESDQMDQANRLVLSWPWTRLAPQAW